MAPKCKVTQMGLHTIGIRNNFCLVRFKIEVQTFVTFFLYVKE